MIDGEKISAARLNLTIDKYPYLSYILYNMSPVESPGLKTMAVDKWWRLYYDPDLDWDVKTLASVLYHEAGHIMRDHANRGEGFNHRLFNIAGDMEINDDIRDEGIWTLPEWVVYPESYGAEPNNMAEFYYNYLIENAKECNGDCGCDGCEGEHIYIPNPKSGGSCQHNKPQNGKDCGSVADGEKRDWEKGGEGSRKVSQAEGDLIRRKTAEDIANQIATQGRGTVPGWMERWAEDLLNPKVNWRAVLRAMVNSAISHVAGNVDFSYHKPSRRAAAIPQIVLPSMIEPEVQVGVVIDTSGSMGTNEIDEAMAEVSGIIRSCGTKIGVNVIACDAAAENAQRVFSASQVKLAGGGGTDMRVGIEAAQEARPHPDIIIVLSDGYTPWPSEPIRERLIIGIVGAGDTGDCPEWAHSIKIGDD